MEIKLAAFVYQNHSRGQKGLYNTMELMDLLDVIDMEKCRKMGTILVKTARIRVKVFRECDLSISRLDFK